MWNNGHAEVKFLDHLGREKASYILQKENDNFLFLRSRYYWDYNNEDPELHTFDAVTINEVHEEPNGYMKHIVIDKDENTKETTEYRDVPNETNWEPVPEFGQWDSISRFDR